MALVGREVLVPWPGQDEVRVWMVVADVRESYGHGELLVAPKAAPGVPRLWVRRWYDVYPLAPEEPEG